MREIVRRALNSPPELTAELLRRGMFRPEEKTELLRRSGSVSSTPPLGSIQFATLLATRDAQIAAHAVLRGLLTREELQWLERLLKLGKMNGKREELARIVDRAVERSASNARQPR